jgi:hypothetical protein
MPSNRELMDRHNGHPWCDTCEQQACWSETWGWLHTSDEFPYGIPTHLDPNPHEVTAKAWYATPLFGTS